MICVMAVDKEQEVTIFYSHQYLRAGQERDKVVLKYLVGFTKFLNREIESFDLDLNGPEVNLQAGTSGLSPDSLTRQNIDDHQERCSPSNIDFSDPTSKCTQNSEESAPSQNASTLTPSSNLPDGSHENAESAPSQNANGSQFQEPQIDYVFETLGDKEVEAAFNQILSDEFLQEPVPDENHRQIPLETDQPKQEDSRLFGYFELDINANCIEIFTEAGNQKYQIAKKIDNLDLFEKYWMSDDLQGRSKQFNEIVKPKFDLFEIIREGRGSGLVFIPFEEVFDKAKQVSCASVWKNSMGKGVDVPMPDPLCLVIFDRSKSITYTGEFNDIST